RPAPRSMGKPIIRTTQSDISAEVGLSPLNSFPDTFMRNSTMAIIVVIKPQSEPLLYPTMDRRAFLRQTGNLKFLNDQTWTNTAVQRLRQSEANPIPLETLSNDLAPYTGAWTDRQIWHLLRRAM